MGAGSSYCNKPDDQKKAHLVALLRGGGLYGNKFAVEVASYMSHPHMLAATTAERKYVELYESLDKEARKSLINPYEFLRFKEEHGMNSDLQAVAVICGKAFGEAFYHDWLMAKFDEYPGRAKGKLITQFGPDEAMRRMVANGQLKPIRCADLSFIHRPNSGPWKAAYPVELVPWPRPVDKDFSGRLPIQPVDRRVVFKAPKRAAPSSNDLSHCSRSTQVDEFAWAPNKVCMPGPPLHKYRYMCEIPFLGLDVLPRTEHHTVFGSASDETHVSRLDRFAHCWAMHQEIWDRLLNDPSIHKDIRECFEALPEGPAKQLVRIALTLRSGTAQSVGWCTCLTGFKFAQFLASEYYCVDVMDLHEALRELERRFGSTEVTTGEQGVVSEALAHYAFESECVPLDELFLDKECTRSVADHPRKVKRGVKIYERRGRRVCCYECTAHLQTKNGYTPTEMVVLPVPGRDVGIASPLNCPEKNFTERLSQFDVRCCSIWPDNRNAFEELRRLMGDEAYKPSTSYFIVVRHIISGQAGRRGVVIFNKDGVAFASVTGARDLYAFDYPLHLISNECFDRVRAAPDGTPHSRYDGKGPGYQPVVDPLADWLTARGSSQGLKNWLAPCFYTPHLVMLRVALEATNATVPDGFPEVPSSVRAKLSEDKSLAYCSFYKEYVEGECELLDIDFARMLCLGAPTPREVSHRRANTRSCVLS